MQGRRGVRWFDFRGAGRYSPGLIVTTAFFVVGSVAGMRFAALCDPASRAALRDYLIDFCTVMHTGVPEVPLVRTCCIYLFYTVSAFLLGFSSLGVLLLPMLSAVFGFAATFPVACFIQAFSRFGILPAAALLFPRSVSTMFCFLVIASEALPQATRVALLSVGRGKRCEPVFHGKQYFYRFFICVLLLFVGICCERIMTPVLFRAAMEHIAPYAGIT